MTASAFPLLVLLAAATPSPPATKIPDPPKIPGAGETPRREHPGLPALKPGQKLVVSADVAGRRQLPKGEDGAELSLVTFTGNVTATRGELKLTCAKLEVLFAKTAAADGKKASTEPRTARARGRVVIRTPRRKAVAEEADYDLAAERFTLRGKKRPVIYQDGDAVAAERFVFHRGKGVFEARGRTSAVILARKKPDAKPGAEERPPERDAKPGPSLARKTRIDAAGGAIYDEGKRRLFLRKDVLVRQKGFRLSCERLWVLFSPRKSKKGEKPKPDAKPGENPLAGSFAPGSVTRIIAAGKVRLRGESRTAEAELASYDPVARAVTLGGKKRAPVIRDGENFLTAPLIVYHLASGRIESPNGPFKLVVREKKPGGAKPPGAK